MSRIDLKILILDLFDMQGRTRPPASLPSTDQLISAAQRRSLCVAVVAASFHMTLAAVIKCVGPPGRDGDCCPEEDKDCCPKGEFCSDNACLSDGTATLVPCGPSKCCDPPPQDECCPEDAATCACGFCNADPEAPTYCKPGPGTFCMQLS
jgi:hypothetical protein